jgi:hypothetical protein
MSGAPRVGIIDSGIGVDLYPQLLDGARFKLVPQGVELTALSRDSFGHGSEVARAIALHAPDAHLMAAQVFNSTGTTSAAVVAEALHWLVDAGAQLVNMSFGLREDRDVLRDACDAAHAAGVVMVASVPAQGGVVYPAWYDDVIRVIGDRRCAPGQISELRGVAHFGASTQMVNGSAGGASLAVAHVTGLLAAAFADDAAQLNRDTAMVRLSALASCAQRTQVAERQHAPV